MTPSTAPNSPNIRPKGPRPGFDVRRLRRASQTSMENGTFNPTPLPSSFSHLDSLGNAKPALTQAARPKSFSIAVFIEVNSNVRLHFTRLAFQQESRLTEAVMRFQQSLYELYSAPRIQAPLWLNINTYPSKRSEYSASFMTELVHLMQESPSSSRLVAEAISAVLSYHVSWVPTIAPANQELIRANTQGAYDPLWAQLSDLYGNIGTFSRVSRTIVVGSNASFVRRLLYLLSYFIRCNEVFLCVTEFKDEPESLLSPPKATRNPFDLHEDEESGSPATMMRSISIPKRPKIDTFASRGSVISRSSVSSRLTSIGEPTTPVLPNQLNQQGDRPLTPLTQSRPLFDTTRPRLDNKDSPSSGSTPCQSRPTTPTTIESRPDSDRVGEEQGSQQQQQQQQYQMATPDHHLRADISRSRTVSSENAESGTLLPNKDDNTREVDYSVQDVLMDVPIPLPRVVCSYPPYPTSSSSPLSNVAKCSILPATNGVSSAVLSSSELSGAGSGSGSGSGVGMGPGAGIGSVSGSGLGLGIGSGPGSPSQDGGAILPADVLFCKSYGRSLMAPYCDHYMPDFALMGVPKCDFLDPMEADMRDTMRHFELQEKVASATCIVADANTWKCNVYSARSSTLEAPGDRMDGGVTMQSPLASLFLDSTLQQMVNLANNGIAAEH
ncbi:Folliculin-interacting protein 1, partial [Lunasporangiospora selenospora]